MSPLTLQDVAPPRQRFLDDVLAGLRRRPKRLPSKYFYDRTGSELFDRICELDEYYLTRTELAIMRAHAPEMAAALGRGCVLVEYGSGSSRKTRVLLDHLARPAAYVPVDISREHLDASARKLARNYPQVPVHPVCADFTAPFDLPPLPAGRGRVAVYFPGSTVGNFDPQETIDLLAGIAELVGPDGGLLIGVDLRKSVAILEAAYDDRQGVTAAFNLNLLARVNRELGADFELDRFRHRAFFNADESRVEMHLVATEEHEVHVGGELVEFRRGESIHTENSYKYTLDHFAALAGEAGFDVERVWTDDRRLFSVQYLVVRS